MNSVVPDDDALENLIGAIVPSEVLPDVGYRIVWITSCIMSPCGMIPLRDSKTNFANRAVPKIRTPM